MAGLPSCARCIHRRAAGRRERAALAASRNDEVVVRAGIHMGAEYAGAAAFDLRQ